MKNMRWLVIFGLLAMVLAPVSALADMDATFHGEARFRAENVENYFDFDDDGLLDFVLFDSQQFDVPLQIGRNLGALPGTPAGQPPILSLKRLTEFTSPDSPGALADQSFRTSL